MAQRRCNLHQWATFHGINIWHRCIQLINVIHIHLGFRWTEPVKTNESVFLTLDAYVLNFEKLYEFNWTWFSSFKVSIWYVNPTLMSSWASSVCHCPNICLTSQMPIVCAHTFADVHSAVHGTLDVYHRVMSTGSFELLCHAVLNFTYKRNFLWISYALFASRNPFFYIVYKLCVWNWKLKQFNRHFIARVNNMYVMLVLVKWNS